MNEPKKKVIVFAWDIAHNAVGRAFLFVDVLKEKFDVTLIGPKFKQFGDTLWSPLVGKLINYRGYEGSDFPTFYSQVKKEIKLLLEQKKFFISEIQVISFIYEIFPSDANFILARVDDSQLRYDQLIKKGIVVRNPSNQYLCENTLRITLGTEAENKALIKALKTMDQQL